MNFLIVEQDPVVKLDFVDTLGNQFPNASVLAVTTLSEAKAAIQSWANISAALIGTSITDILKSDLAALVEERHGKFIVSHYGASDSSEIAESNGWVLLSIPFTNDSLLEALSKTGI